MAFSPKSNPWIWESAPTNREAGEAGAMDAARDDCMDMFRGSLDADATVGRCGEVACNLRKMEKALRETFLEIHSSSECTVYPALIQALQDLVQSARHTNEHYSHRLDCLASELEKAAEMVCQGEKGRKHMFLMNNTFGVLQIISRPGASCSELVSTLASMIQRHKECYFNECWVPLLKTLHLNLDEFTAKFLDTCGNQMPWKVTAELRYKLREEIVDLIVPPYKVSLSALQENRSRVSGVLCSFQGVIAGKKKQKKYTGEELEEKIKALFEG
ncbi:unnamed protein product [Alopecurus aequalis]